MSAGCLCQSHGRSPEVQGFFLPHAAIHCRQSAINNAQRRKRVFLSLRSSYDGNVAASAALHGLRLELLIAIFVHLTLCSWMLTLCFYQLANNGCSCVCRPLEGTWCRVWKTSIRGIGEMWHGGALSARKQALIMHLYVCCHSPAKRRLLGLFLKVRDYFFCSLECSACILAALHCKMLSSWCHNMFVYIHLTSTIHFC